MKNPMSLWRLVLAPFAAGILTILSPALAGPPPGLVTDGVPEIPEALQQTVDRYGAVTANVFMSWDPKSGAMLINSVNDGTMQLHVLPSPGGEMRLSTVFPDVINSGSFLPSTGDEIVFAADHNGDEFYQLYRLDPATGQKQILTDGISRNMDVIYDHGGKQIAFLSTMPAAANPVIYAMDPRDPDSRHIIMTLTSNNWQLQDWSHDGLHILASHHHTSSVGYLWSINSTTGETKLLTTQPETQRPYGKALFAPYDEGIYVIVQGAEQGTLDYLPLVPNGPVPKLPTGATKVNDMALSPDGAWLAYRTEESDAQKLHLFNTGTGEELPQPALPPGFFSRMRWNANGELGFNYGSAALPMQAFSYNVATRQLVQWTTPGAAADAVFGTPVKPELVKIPSFDDLPISGYLYRPDPLKFPGRRPVLIRIHGGPEDEFRPSFLGPYNYYLNELGVALFYPNVRGSSGFGSDFANLDNGFKREDAVKDMGAFLGWIATDSRLDRNRIGVQGGSYGGYMTLATLYHYGNLLRCGSEMMGITDFVTFLRNTETYRRANRRFEYGDERYPEMNKFLESVSPLNHVREIHDPVMITAGKNDPRVPVTESDQMVQALRAQNGIIWYILGENEGHSFRRVSDAHYQFAAEAYFFQKYLLPEKRLTPIVSEPATDQAPPVSTSGSGPD